MDKLALRPERGVLDDQELLRRCLGNRDLAARILEKFRVQLEADLGWLAEAIRCCNCDEAALAAHRIKGASANVSAHGLKEMAAELERVARHGEHDLLSHLAALQKESRRLVRTVSAFDASHDHD